MDLDVIEELGSFLMQTSTVGVLSFQTDFGHLFEMVEVDI